MMAHPGTPVQELFPIRRPPNGPPGLRARHNGPFPRFRLKGGPYDGNEWKKYSIYAFKTGLEAKGLSGSCPVVRSNLRPVIFGVDS